jgi:hypothetical protein
VGGTRRPEGRFRQWKNHKENPEEPLLALEILVPICERDRMVKDFLSGESAFNTALRLRIPETLVIFFVRSNYNLFFKQSGGIEA